MRNSLIFPSAASLSTISRRGRPWLAAGLKLARHRSEQIANPRHLRGQPSGSSHLSSCSVELASRFASQVTLPHRRLKSYDCLLKMLLNSEQSGHQVCSGNNATICDLGRLSLPAARHRSSNFVAHFWSLRDLSKGCCFICGSLDASSTDVLVRSSQIQSSSVLLLGENLGDELPFPTCRSMKLIIVQLGARQPLTSVKSDVSRRRPVASCLGLACSLESQRSLEGRLVGLVSQLHLQRRRPASSCLSCPRIGQLRLPERRPGARCPCQCHSLAWQVVSCCHLNDVASARHSYCCRDSQLKCRSAVRGLWATHKLSRWPTGRAS